MSKPDPILRVLLIDDDPTVVDLLSALLSLEGHEVHAADSAEQALSLVEARARLDLILTDLHLPGMQGAALATALRAAKEPQTLLFAMSGSQPAAELADRFDYFLLKPFDVADVVEAVTAVRAQKSTRPVAAPEGSAQGGESPVDEAVFARLAKALPATQLRQLYELTLTDARKRLERMAAAEAAGDEATMRSEAHALKGGTGMVGARELHLLAARREGGSLGNTPPLADFRAACDRLGRMLDARFTSTEPQHQHGALEEHGNGTT